MIDNSIPKPTNTPPSSQAAPEPEPEITVAKGPSRPFNTWQALQTVTMVAIIVASLFTLWTPASLFNDNFTEKLSQALIPNKATQVPLLTPTPHAKPKIGIIAGHYGNDSGAVCPDGTTEADVNLKIATLVRENLVAQGYEVDLLKEFDPRLMQYQAMLLVSIHNDTCDYIGTDGTGFKVAAAQFAADPGRGERLSACLVDRYGRDTGLPFDYNRISTDMTQYHAFNEVNSITTAAAIIETGYLNLNKDLLTQHTDVVAKGVTDGIMCFLHNEQIAPALLEPTPTP
jgi:N-acetylmuramoyl-L-alanine amidase